MGIICSRWQEQAGGAKKLLIANHSGSALFNALPAGMSGLESQITVDPTTEIAYVHDDASTGKVFAIDLSAGNVGDVLDTWTWSSEWGAIRVLFHQVTDGGYLLGTNFGGDGKLYISNTAFDEEYSYQLSDNDVFADLKITPNKAFIYFLNNTDKKIHKLAVNQIKDYDNQAAFEAACEWTVTLTEQPHKLGLDTTNGDLIVNTFDTNDTDVKTYRLSQANGSTVWSQDYGYNVPALDVTNGFVYVGNGSDGGGTSVDADKLLYSDGTIDDTEKNSAPVANPSRVWDAAIAHDQAICFFGGWRGGNIGRLWAVSIPAFVRQWGITNGINPEIRFSGDPSGYHNQQMADTGAAEPNWGNPSFVPYANMTKNFRDGVLTIKGQTSDGAVHHTVVLDQGDLVWTQTQEVIEVLDRGALGHIRKGDERRVDVGFMLKYQNLQADTVTTAYEAIKQVGAASTWQNLDSNDIYTISLVFELLNTSNSVEETITFDRFFWESIEFHERSDYDTLLVTGGSFQVVPGIQ